MVISNWEMRSGVISSSTKALVLESSPRAVNSVIVRTHFSQHPQFNRSGTLARQTLKF